MAPLKTITVAQAYAYWKSGHATVVDIRDLASFSGAHIPNAFHLTSATLNPFIQQSDVDHPIMVLCYHGISSRNAAEYLLQQGFTVVYSIDGGFEAWQRQYPDEIESAPISGESDRSASSAGVK